MKPTQHERGMEMMIRGVLIDVVNNAAKVVEIDKKLESYYKILNCNLIDITSRYIGDKLFDIICDDEGLLKENFKVSAITRSLGPALVGNLFVVKHDGKGNERSLTKKEVEYVLERVKLVYCNLYEEGRIMLTEVETQKL